MPFPMDKATINLCQQYAVLFEKADFMRPNDPEVPLHITHEYLGRAFLHSSSSGGFLSLGQIWHQGPTYRSRSSCQCFIGFPCYLAVNNPYGKGDGLDDLDDLEKPVEAVEPSCTRLPDNHGTCFYFSMENLLRASTPAILPTPAIPIPAIPIPTIPIPAIPIPAIPIPAIPIPAIPAPQVPFSSLDPTSLWAPTDIPPDASKTTLSQAALRGYLHESDITLIRESKNSAPLGNTVAFIVCCYLACRLRITSGISVSSTQSFSYNSEVLIPFSLQSMTVSV
ncbi:hypothetical protein PTI98_009084 [Pleurotus ostreatus]|nr:hypothetical protein PTI98_009084 [Pleurotus ostreatus]